MNKSGVFIKRNVKECLRDPVTYVFCLAFPVAMLVLFAAINSAVAEKQAIFEYASLIPGVIVFGFSFVSLSLCLLVSKDCKTAFLRRLYTSPLKPTDFASGYAVIGVILGTAQAALTIFAGYILSLITGGEYFSFASACLLILSQLPELVICVLTGILFGKLLSEKAAPAVCSAFVSGSGIFGGVWMPLDAIKGFEKACEFLPFYPSVKIGRAITGAVHTVPNAAGEFAVYTFDTSACLGFLTLGAYVVVFAAACIFAFNERK